MYAIGHELEAATNSRQVANKMYAIGHELEAATNSRQVADVCDVMLMHQKFIAASFT